MTLDDVRLRCGTRSEDRAVRWTARVIGSAVPAREPSESSAAIRARVDRARAVQLARFHGRTIFGNAQMQPRDLRHYCTPHPDAESLLENAMTRLALSARAYTRILKVARTIADLDGADTVGAAQVAEAIQYRGLDRAFH